MIPGVKVIPWRYETRAIPGGSFAGRRMSGANWRANVCAAGTVMSSSLRAAASPVATRPRMVTNAVTVRRMNRLSQIGQHRETLGQYPFRRTAGG